MGGRVPKQFLRVGGTTILRLTLGRFARHPEVSEIIIVAPREHVKRVERLVHPGRPRKLIAVVPGGRERQDSVRRGLEALSEAIKVVLVHDAVRPLVRTGVITRVIRQAKRHGAAVVATRVRDTIKMEGTPGTIAHTVPREKLWAVQTPQGFRREILVRAHARAAAQKFLGTDECSLVERLGETIRIVPGDASNIKITTREDIRLAEFLRRGVRG
jgi:2-C-methyl-D-erythritol 4-phosphate cytidylyltransferase